MRAVAQDTRSQARNRELALERLRGRLEGALAVRGRAARRSPRAASKQRRAESKRRRGEVKRLRRRPSSRAGGPRASSALPRRRPRPGAGRAWAAWALAHSAAVALRLRGATGVAVVPPVPPVAGGVPA